jgi:adenine-specific DNA-methyltransferase
MKSLLTSRFSIKHKQLEFLRYDMYYDSVHVKTEYYTHIMKYMGSKRELLGEIRKIVNEQKEDDKAFLDIFAGTCGVGMAVRDLAPVYSNDIQYYSSIIADGCLNTKLPNLDEKAILSMLETNLIDNYEHAAALIPNTLTTSNKFKERQDWDDDERLNYVSFADSFASHVLGEPTEKLRELVALKNEYKKRQSEPTRFPYLQTTYLFSEMYFGLEQAITLDSLRYAIDKLALTNKKLANALLVALIHAYSYCSAGTGHFAQFRDLSTLSSIKDVFTYRKRSVLDYFLRKAEEILNASNKNEFAGRNKAFTRDYISLLEDKRIMKDVGMIYADPPYSFVHYSRFYHAVEDLCRYDYPEVEHKGRYRKDRHQSPFCIKTKAPGAFNTLFSLARRNNSSLLVSYSNTGMISLERLHSIAKENNYKIDTLEIDHKHSTMGRLKDRHRDVKEALLLCLVN